MKIRMLFAVVVLASLGLVSHAGARVGVAIGVGFPLGCYRPYCGYGYYCYRPYYYPAVYVAPPPVVVEAAPVAQPVAVLQPVPSAPPTPAPSTQPVVRAAASADQNAEADRYLQHLNNPDERSRSEAMLQLGRMRAARAIEPLTRALSTDQSPVAREAAARALGLIAAPSSLQALQEAAQADNDRDVRNSARFAADVIRSHTPPR